VGGLPPGLIENGGERFIQEVSRGTVGRGKGILGKEKYSAGEKE